MDEVFPEGCCQGEEGDGGPAHEVGEDEKGHPLRYSHVVRVPGLGVADGEVHDEVTAQDDEEGDAVEYHDEADIP